MSDSKPEINLLSDIYHQMEVAADQERMRKILQKRPQMRSRSEIERLMERTEEVPVMTFNGASLHKDLCHVLKCKVLDESEMLKITADQISGQAFYLVLAGNVRVQCQDPSQLGDVITKAGRGQELNKKQEVSRKRGVTESEMVSLFNTIDTDGSGAIDAEELTMALEMMGLNLSKQMVVELIDCVDDDGSRELEYPEFKQIIVDKLGLGEKSEHGVRWTENNQGEWSREYPADSWFGEKCLLEPGTGMSLTVLALEPTTLALMDQQDFVKIRDNGFDGDLNKKVELLRGLAAIQGSIHNTDLRTVAFVTRVETWERKAIICQEGCPAVSLHFLLEGGCKVLKKLITTQTAQTDARKSLCLPRGSFLKNVQLQGKTSTHAHQIEIALLGRGDIFGQDAVGSDRVHGMTIVASTDVKLLAMDVKDLERTLQGKDFHQLIGLVNITTNWRKSHIQKALNIVNAAQEISGNPDAHKKAQIRQNTMEDATNAENKRSALSLDIPLVKRFQGSASSRGPHDRSYSLPQYFHNEGYSHDLRASLTRHVSLPANSQPCSTSLRDEHKRRRSITVALPELLSFAPDDNLEKTYWIESVDKSAQGTLGQCEEATLFYCKHGDSEQVRESSNDDGNAHLSQIPPAGLSLNSESCIVGKKPADISVPNVKVTRCNYAHKQADNCPNKTLSTASFWTSILGSNDKNQASLNKAIQTAAINRYKSTDYLADIRKEADSRQALAHIGALAFPKMADICTGHMPARKIRKPPAQMTPLEMLQTQRKIPKLGGVEGISAKSENSPRTKCTKSADPPHCKFDEGDNHAALQKVIKALYKATIPTISDFHNCQYRTAKSRLFF